jgi:hypothetical protein
LNQLEEVVRRVLGMPVEGRAGVETVLNARSAVEERIEIDFDGNTDDDLEKSIDSSWEDEVVMELISSKDATELAVVKPFGE